MKPHLFSLRSLTWSVMFILIVAFAPACALLAGGAAGAATATYFSGELRSIQEQPLTQVYRASEDTVSAMNYTIKEKELEDFSAYLKTAESPTERVTITMKELGEATTELRIRVGILGDELQSKRILEDIESRLGAPVRPTTDRVQYTNPALIQTT